MSLWGTTKEQPSQASLAIPLTRYIEPATIANEGVKLRVSPIFVRKCKELRDTLKGQLMETMPNWGQYGSAGAIVETPFAVILRLTSAKDLRR